MPQNVTHFDSFCKTIELCRLSTYKEKHFRIFDDDDIIVKCDKN